MDLPKLWKTALAELELSVSRGTFQIHFSQSQLISLQDNVATVGIVNPLMRTMVETRYYSLVKSILDHHTNENISMIFVTIPKKQSLAPNDVGPLFAQAVEAPSAMSIARKLHINPDSTFDNYAVSTTNQMAYAAATAVAKAPGSAYNPLFLYGGVGVGKTHLMHSVANSLLAKKPHLRVVYCMGEEFLNEIVEAIQTKTARQFKQKYRNAQLFLVDDVQFIAGKQTAQEEFFHTFNAIHREGGQIILTSDRHPGEIAKLEDRLRSRFEGGLIIDISPPDFELRAAIINIKAKAMGVSLPPDVAQLIAGNISDTRGLEGFLRRLVTEVTTKKIPINPETVAPLFGNKLGGGESKAGTPTSKRVAPQEVLALIATYFGVKETQLKGPKRDRPIARPRQLFMYLCKVELRMTLDDIGGVLGGRDHTTIMHGVDTITNELSTNARLREALEGIKLKLWA